MGKNLNEHCEIVHVYFFSIYYYLQYNNEYLIDFLYILILRA